MSSRFPRPRLSQISTQQRQQRQHGQQTTLNKKLNKLLEQRQRKEKAKQESEKKERNKKNKEERNKKKIKNISSRSLNEDSQDIINKLKYKINNILKGSNKPLDKLNNIIVEIYKAYGAVDEVCVIVKKSIKTLSETNRNEILAKIKDYSRVTTKLNEIVEKIKSIEKKVENYNKYKDEINKTVKNLSKNQDIINKINYIDNKLLVDSEGTIKNQIDDLKKLIKKRLSKPNMWIPPKGLEKIKNKDKGLEKKVTDLYNLFNESQSSLMKPIIDILDKPMEIIQNIKTKSFKNSNKNKSIRNYGTQTENPYRRGGSKKSVKINNSNIHKYLNVPKSYKFRKSSIERINKVKLNEYFTFRRNRYKMNKIIKKNINLANSFLNN